MKLLSTLLLVAGAAATEKYYRKFERDGRTVMTAIEANEPELGCDTVKQYSGYFDADGLHQYFYWFFESRDSPSTDPLIMWLTGGPGCSSVLALLAENGPCTVNDQANGVNDNPYSWNSNANVMWVDQPPGTGFSTGVYDTNEDEIALDMWDFLQNFMDAFPQYFQNGFYVFGESYAGHYVPAISNFIYEKNQVSSNTPIPLKGFAVGNGLTDPYTQYAYYAEMAYNSTYAPSVISRSRYRMMVNHIAECQAQIKACNDGTDSKVCDAAETYCNEWEIEPVTISGINPYDVRVQCGDNPLCYNFTAVDLWLNNATVQKQLGVDKKWESCDNGAHAALISDWMLEYSEKVPPMLEGGIRGLIYAGDQDFICNWIGNKHWALELDWSGKSDFNAADDLAWSPDGIAQRGRIRHASDFTFLQVFKAGHMVPMDQPQSALYMVNGFITDTL